MFSANNTISSDILMSTILAGVIFSVQEMAAIYPDRVIAIRGSVESMSQVEAAISTKLRESHERDAYSFNRVTNTNLVLRTGGEFQRIFVIVKIIIPCNINPCC